MPIGYLLRTLLQRLRLAAARQVFWACCWLGCGLLQISKRLGRKPRREDC